MTNVRRQRGREGDEHGTSLSRNLPLRWVVILAVATAVGFAVGHFATAAAGLAAGLGLAAFLHKVID
jgi:hypothetical protein